MINKLYSHKQSFFFIDKIKDTESVYAFKISWIYKNLIISYISLNITFILNICSEETNNHKLIRKLFKSSSANLANITVH